MHRTNFFCRYTLIHAHTDTHTNSHIYMWVHTHAHRHMHMHAHTLTHAHTSHHTHTDKTRDSLKMELACSPQVTGTAFGHNPTQRTEWNFFALSEGIKYWTAMGLNITCNHMRIVVVTLGGVWSAELN